MRLSLKSNLFYIFPIALLLGASSCRKTETYPETPEIEYKSLDFIPNSKGVGGKAIITLSFTDGDGDIGLRQSDTIEPYKYNCYISLYIKEKGSFNAYILPNPELPYNSRIPILESDGHNKTLKGSITDTVSLLQNDTLKLELYIKDRALQKSNTITTPAFTIKGGIIK